MEKKYYINAGIPLPELSEPAMQSWNSFSLPQEVNCTSILTSACSLNPYFHKQNDHFTQFHSALSSVVSSPPTSSVLNKAIGIRELIQKLGPICNPGGNPAPFSSGAGLVPAPSVHVGNAGVVTPVFTAKPQGVPISNEFVKEILPDLANSLILNPPPLPAISTDSEFAERAAKFYNFGNRSFTAQNDTELPPCSSAMARVWSSPLQQGGSPMGNQKSCQAQMEIKKLNELPPIAPNSNESSSISEQVPSGETVSEVSNEINSRKRKAVSKSKAKKNVSAEAINSQKAAEADDAKNRKRAKTTEVSPSGKDGINREGEEAMDGVSAALDEKHKQDKVTQKPSEPPKDYIHVRARRGQATDSHSLAERVRREKIGERMKLLQDLVPGCNKVTGKALMLDEIINYVQSLQRQVEFLSMKLASVDPRQEVHTDNFTSKAMMQPNGSLSHSLYPVDFSLPSFYGHQPKQLPSVDTNASMSQCSVDPVHRPSYHNLELQLPSLNGFADGLPQFLEFCEDDLHSVVRMGFSQDANREAAFQSMNFPVANQLQPSP